MTYPPRVPIVIVNGNCGLTWAIGMLREVIIDGYNLLHAAGLARPAYGPGDLDRCRKRLLLRLADLIDEVHRSSVTIIFDAKEPPHDVPDRGQFKSMLVRYAVGHAEADDLIEQLIHVNSTPRRLLVVSGDQRLRQAARRKGAHSISGEEFLDALESEADERASSTTAAGPATSMDDVIQELTAIDVDSLLQEIESERPAECAVARGSTAGSATSAEALPDDLAPAQPVDESRNVTSTEEVRFWNARIAELLREEGRAE